ncbi:DNA damage-binding protein cmr1 [Penicillium capsulatum]|uniref:DNA damage-binding protein CMR1 n=1 Tax=Penicillium capsulatum TaxID=69766 RepID=A0A9W9LV86_9EURO|nr:DNA damage-binding protein cmr1 [Penicillium capsulatum]
MAETNSGLSEFEKQRLENIAKRDEILRDLKLAQQTAGIFHAPKRPASHAKPRKPAPKRVKTEPEQIVRRQSSRIRGKPVDTESTKRKAEEDLSKAQEAERASKSRKTDDLSQNDMFVAGQKLSTEGLIGGDVVTKAVAEPYVRTFGDDDIVKTTDKDLRAVREEMNGLKLWDKWEHPRIKVTPERIYTMTFHPTESKPIIFAGDKLGHLGILDASQEKPTPAEDDDEDDPDPVITTLKPHTRTLVSMLIHPSKPTHLYTASYDSSIRELDLEKTLSVEKYAPEDVHDEEAFSDVDMAANDPNTLYWTTLHGSLGRYDTRAKQSESTVSHWQLSEKKIGGFSLCPSNPTYFATASLDRTMRLWDIRMLTKEEPEPVAVHESRLSVSHAAFNAVGQIATSSYDDTLKIYDVGKGMGSWEKGHTLSEKEFRPDHVVRHNCQCGRWVTM